MSTCASIKQLYIVVMNTNTCIFIKEAFYFLKVGSFCIFSRHWADIIFTQLLTQCFNTKCVYFAED